MLENINVIGSDPERMPPPLNSEEDSAIGRKERGSTVKERQGEMEARDILMKGCHLLPSRYVYRDPLGSWALSSLGAWTSRDEMLAAGVDCDLLILRLRGRTQESRWS